MLLLFNCSVVSDCFQPHGLKHARLPCPIPSSGVCNSCPLSQWCHPTISSSVTSFSSCPQSFPGSGFFPMSWLFTSSGQSIGASASASVLPVNIQCWFPLGLTGLVSFLCICAHIMKTSELHSLIVWYVTYFNKTITKENLWPSTNSNELYNI